MSSTPNPLPLVKNRNPKIEKMLDEISLDFINKNKNNSGTALLQDKINNLIWGINNKISTKCAKEIEEIQKYAKIEDDGKGQITVNKLPGKEAEADAALLRLDQCQMQYTLYFQGITSLSQFSLGLIEKQSELCFDECERKFDINSQEGEMRSCLSNCYDFGANFSVRAVENLISSQIDIIQDELQKI
jgi:hypothetical protein